ncbi:MAG: hypothetical protein MJZ24_04285 [Paludibacteraceae bacterium]|nr:hypothetical protein [Paludibacteraceae bacterium]
MTKFLRLIPFLIFAACFQTACSEIIDTDDEIKQDSAKTNAFAVNLFDYQYGPGQHLRMLENCPPTNIIGDKKGTVLLGGWGGYIVAGFDHDIVNEKGTDLIIFCGSSVSPEPGIIYVMEDENGNGTPDDEWLEIKGSEYNNPDCIHNYHVTYFKPASEFSNVSWKDNLGNAGELPNSKTWWQHPDKDSLSFSGTRLPDAYFNAPQPNGNEYWAVFPHLFRYGYAENGGAPDRNSSSGFLASDFSTEHKGNMIELDSAVNKQGQFAPPASIRFVKIQTGVFQQAGWLGEISTEINGMADFRMYLSIQK